MSGSGERFDRFIAGQLNRIYSVEEQLNRRTATRRLRKMGIEKVIDVEAGLTALYK